LRFADLVPIQRMRTSAAPFDIMQIMRFFSQMREHLCGRILMLGCSRKFSCKNGTSASKVLMLLRNQKKRATP
jgi:hypothetical protein